MATNRYAQIIEAIFHSKFRPGMEEVEFKREAIETFARELKVELPKNIGDLVYSFRYRTPLPESIRQTAPQGKQWLILPAGRARYRFVARAVVEFIPNPALVRTKVPDATPGVIAMYALSDEQSLLAKLRYNRLIDIFTRVTCYSLQSHLRTTVPRIGQVETDEMYVGVDRHGAHFVFPVQAKGARDRLSAVQIQQDFALCADKYPSLIARPIGAQFLQEEVIALFEFQDDGEGARIASEKHYELVSPDEIGEQELKNYRLLGTED